MAQVSLSFVSKSFLIYAFADWHLHFGLYHFFGKCQTEIYLIVIPKEVFS